MVDFSERLRQLIDSKGVRIAHLARESGVNDGTIRGYARGRREPTAENASKLASALGVTTDYLLTGANVPAPQVEEREPSETELLFRAVQKARGVKAKKAALATAIAALSAELVELERGKK